MRFFDFFSGIGGFRLGMEMAGHECVGHCEIDKYANMSYMAMHKPKDTEVYFGDIASEIDKMENVKYKELLYSRYVLLLPWSQVAKRLDDLRPGKEYELKSVIGYMHRRALKEFEEVHDERSNLYD